MTTPSLKEIRYINISALKVAIAEWHRQEFERAEDSYRADHFFREQFLDAIGHSDGVFLQLAAAFDAFACAVAFSVGMSNPHKADFATSNDELAKASSGDLGDRIRSTAADGGFARLTAYRNIAAHRSVTTGRTVLRANVSSPTWTGSPSTG